MILVDFACDVQMYCSTSFKGHYSEGVRMCVCACVCVCVCVCVCLCVSGVHLYGFLYMGGALMW